MLCPGMAVAVPSVYLPWRGPKIQAAERAVRPPRIWMVAAPPASVKAGRLKSGVSWESQPLLQTQWAKSGKMIAAKRALVAQMEASRQRSLPELRGMSEARPTAKMPKARVSAA